MEVRILQLEDAQLILEFERTRPQDTDTMERELASWSARWREEALNHYLPLGWSFGVFGEGQLQGYLLAQPLLFFRGLTQTLWVERLAFLDLATGQKLAETAWRWAKDKHFQRLLLSETDPGFSVQANLTATIEQEKWITMATSRMKT